MSRTVAFGMDALGSGEDLEELLAALTGDEVTHSRPDLPKM